MKYPTIEEALTLIRYLPQRPDYDTWVKSISAIGNTFDETTSLQILLSHFRDEKPNETALKLRYRLSNVNYGTLVYYARENGFTGFNGYNYSNFKTNKRYNYSLKPKQEEPPKFKDEAIVNDNGESCYLASINPKVINKNHSPVTGKPLPDYSALTFGFRNQTITQDKFIQYIGAGYSFVCGHLKTDNKGNTHRKNSNYNNGNMFAIDIDEKLTIDEALKMDFTKKALFIYTTPSHTDKKHRFRIIFPFPGVVYGADDFKKAVSIIIKKYEGADEACKNAGRAFYGNSNAKVWDLVKNEYNEFINGKKV